MVCDVTDNDAAGPGLQEVEGAGGLRSCVDRGISRTHSDADDRRALQKRSVIGANPTGAFRVAPAGFAQHAAQALLAGSSSSARFRAWGRQLYTMCRCRIDRHGLPDFPELSKAGVTANIVALVTSTPR